MTDTVNRFKKSEHQSQVDVNNLLSSVASIGSYLDPKESAKTVGKIEKKANRLRASLANAILAMKNLEIRINIPLMIL